MRARQIIVALKLCAVPTWQDGLTTLNTSLVHCLAHACGRLWLAASLATVQTIEGVAARNDR